MRVLTLLVLTVGTMTLSGGASVAEDVPPQPIEWNVFLDSWKVLGPFPKESGDVSGLDGEYVTRESELGFGQVHFYRNQLYVWKDAQRRVVDFRAALQAPGSKGDDHVGYAWTQFVSPVEQTAQMGVAYDDNFVAWLNGEEVARGTDNWASSLDQKVVDVKLKAGVNTLLLRVANGTSKWDAAVRFLPAGLETPLLDFKATPASNNVRLPVVKVALLDENRRVISEHRCSGARRAYPGVAGYYALYAALPNPAPAFVRLVVDEEHFEAFERVAPWERVQTGDAVVNLLSERPASLVVIDQETRQPIADAQVWNTQSQLEGTTGPDGSVGLPEASPTSDRLFVAARGYEAGTVNLKWPRGAQQRVELVRGGKSLTGIVVSSTGEPLAGALVTPGISGGFSPSVVTNADGRFEFFGIPVSQTRMYPVVEREGYIAMGRLSVDLPGLQTDVRWELTRGATISGRVTDKSGRPLAGMTVTVGQDRFGGSNDRKPVTKTNADGSYELTGVAVGENLLHVFSPDYAPAMRSVSTTLATTTEANFEVEEGQSVSGVITDADGKPLSAVWIVTDTWGGARMFERETRTDGEGRFTLPHMPETPAEIDILKQGFMSRRNYHVVGGETVNVVMSPNVVFTIRIRGEDNERVVPDLQIAKGYLWEGNTDWNWQSNEWETTRYYNQLKGEMRIEVDEETSYETSYRFRTAGFREAIVKLPRDAKEDQTFEVQLKPASVVQGRVVDASTGEPVPYASVAVVSQQDRLRVDQYSDLQTVSSFLDQKRFTGAVAQTNPEGRFSLSTVEGSPAGLGVVVAAPNGAFHYIEGLDEFLTGEQGRGEVLDLPLPAPAFLNGKLSVGGQPVSNARIHVKWLGLRGNSDVVDWNRGFGFGGQVDTDAEGNFVFGSLGPGYYQISRVATVSHDSLYSRTLHLDTAKLLLKPDEIVTHRFEKPIGVSVHGTVVGDDRQPAAGTVVTLAEAGNGQHRVAMAVADERGRFELRNVSIGSYELHAEHYSRQPQGYFQEDMRTTLPLEVMGAVDELTVVLAPLNHGQPLVVAQSLTGTLAPEFSVTPLGADAPFVLSEQRGKVTVLCFWSMWMTNAATEWNGILSKYKDNPDVVLLGIHWGSEEQLNARLPQLGERLLIPTVVSVGRTPPALADTFAMSGESACYVIDRNGRFASEALQGDQLAAAIDRTLQQEWNVGTAGEASLALTLRSDGAGQGIPNVTVGLQAVDGAGNVVLADRYSLPGVARKIVWSYPAVEAGGQVKISLSGTGVVPQERVIKDPSAAEILTLEQEAPRLVTGRVVSVEDEQPVPRLTIRLQSDSTASVEGSTDDEGLFRIRCFPGTYYVVVPDASRFSALMNPPQSVTVELAADPQQVSVRVSPTVTIRGRVLDATGEPVVGATVAGSVLDYRLTDAEGRFEISGIARLGSGHLWALHGDESGGVRLDHPSGADEVVVRLGTQPEQEVMVPALKTGVALPELELQALDGTAVKWSGKSEMAEKQRLIVVAALWHPESKKLVDRAKAWVAAHDSSLEVISLDWSIEQARRESASLELKRVLFAGPLLNAEWFAKHERTALLIGDEGIVIDVPLHDVR